MPLSTAAPDIDAPEGAAKRDVRFNRRHFDRVRALIHRFAGIALSDAKQDMVYSRLIRRMRALGVDSFDAYLDGLEDPAHPEHTPFINALTTNLTAFFREAHHFSRLRQHLRRPGAPSQPLIWCAAASTGEEPYSLAITACEAFESLRPPVRIIATDIDTDALAVGRGACYPLQRLAPLTDEQKRQDFLGAPFWIGRGFGLNLSVVTDPASAVTPNLTKGLVAGVRASHWAGKANRLSPDHVDWAEIAAVEDATVKPHTASLPVRDLAASSNPAQRPIRDIPRSAAIIRQRRSAVDMDARTGLSLDAFFGMLARTLPDRLHPPWTALDFPP